MANFNYGGERRQPSIADGGLENQAPAARLKLPTLGDKSKKKLQFFNTRFVSLVTICALSACFWALLLKTSFVLFLNSIFVLACMFVFKTRAPAGETSQTAGESSHLQTIETVTENNVAKLRKIGEAMASQN